MSELSIDRSSARPVMARFSYYKELRLDNCHNLNGRFLKIDDIEIYGQAYADFQHLHNDEYEK